MYFRQVYFDIVVGSPEPEVINFFHAQLKFKMLISIKYQGSQLFSGSDKLRMLFFPLINVKMPTVFGILTFMSRKNSILSLSEPEKSFITSGPVDQRCTFINRILLLFPIPES